MKTPRLYGLDAARGIAAVSVVFSHWTGFFYVGPRIEVDHARLPFGAILWPFYDYGGMGVDLFFVLSGFVFYWLYADAVSRGMPWRRFFLLRFSRLYPLHFVTLLIVAFEQLVLLPQPYGGLFNDVYHFVLQLLFASKWGFEHGHSFNSPIWSVSVEVMMYGAFFLVCRALPVRLAVPITLMLVGLVLPNYWISRGMTGFFLGGCCYLVQMRVRPAVLLVLMLCAGLALASRHVPYQFVTFFLFAPLVLLLARARGWIWMRLSFLGDISYSVYLLHFPLMLAFVALGLARDRYYSPEVMVVFFAILLVLATLSHRFFERPTQDALRRIRWGRVPEEL